MEKYFFSGGSMPNLDILKMIDHSYKIEELWYVSGMNYHKTLELWYENLKLNKNKIMKTDFKDDKQCRVFYSPSRGNLISEIF